MSEDPSIGAQAPETPEGEPDNISHDDKKSEKITILLMATGSAPIMKTRKWAIEPNRTVSSINSFVKKYIKLEPNESLYLYVNHFAPAPDQTMKNLFDCFGTDGKLVLNYSISQAWG
ncbi:autophagy protein 12-like [Cimex lectularius]|uniref:Ubiquitin-like protein ATG12 n=1 Tax=Cimex lectularius TaxID=79782 RepID=A0A8I6RI38_CIMLE|nr:autophagy protein 12-like [Cimex lectularius]